MKILNQGFDHVEFVVKKISNLAPTLLRMGFEKVGARELPKPGTRSELYQQGFVRILVSEPDGSEKPSEALRFLNEQNEGICVLGIEVDDAKSAFEETVSRGAKPARAPETFTAPQGTVTRAEIFTPGNLRYAFMERKSSTPNEGPALFDEGLVTTRLSSPSPLGIRVIDHLTNNVSMGEMKKWVKYYQDIFGFIVTRRFDIRTSRTGLISDVVQSADGKIKVPINEATEKASQVQEFCDRMRGPGVQHLALLSTGIVDTLVGLRKKDFKFLTVPHTYYETVPTRVKGVTEDLAELESLGILLDGEGEGYLLQIFSQEILGPFFFEYIQRKGDKGFGEGNFRALFEAIERDQISRGVLKG